MMLGERKLRACVMHIPLLLEPDNTGVRKRKTGNYFDEGRDHD